MGWRLALFLVMPLVWLREVALVWWLLKLAAQDQRAVQRLIDKGDGAGAMARQDRAQYRMDWVADILKARRARRR